MWGRVWCDGVWAMHCADFDKVGEGGCKESMVRLVCFFVNATASTKSSTEGVVGSVRYV